MKTQKDIEEMNGVYTCSYGYNLCKKDVLELIEEKIDFNKLWLENKHFKGEDRDILNSFQEQLEELKQRIEGETAQNTNDLVKTNDLQGNITAQNDIKLARQCMDFKMLRCDNKECLNKSCPLQKSWDK